tara:strand:- start:402 stop:515 length:114 start_codon:yes stop_codon:yes gene_type:complete
MHLVSFLFVAEMKNLTWVDITRKLIKSKPGFAGLFKA